jgi:hypothetical protein
VLSVGCADLGKRRDLLGLSLGDPRADHGGVCLGVEAGAVAVDLLDHGLLAGIELPGRAFPVTVDRATVIKNFYVTRLPDGSESDQAEDDFRPAVPPRPGRAPAC